MAQIWCRDFASPTYHNVSNAWVHSGRAQCGQEIRKPVFPWALTSRDTAFDIHYCETCLQIVTELRKEQRKGIARE